MKRYLKILLLATLCLTLLGTTSKGAARAVQNPGTAPFAPGELLVTFEPGRMSAQSAQRALGRFDAAYVRSLGREDVQLWRVPEGREEALAAEISALPGVAYAEPNYVVRAFLTPDDTYYNNFWQWGHNVINSEDAWDISTGVSTVTVAIIDSGLDMDHPEFAGRITSGMDYVEGDTFPNDGNGHGTHVAGIAAGRGNNGIGIAGMAWNVQVMPVKVLASDGWGFTSWVVSGVYHAADNGADVINMSLGGTSNSGSLEAAVNYALNQDVVVVAAAGNCGDSNYEANGCTYQDQPNYPAAYPGVLAVASTNDLDAQSSFSNEGTYVDVAAPGSDIYSTVPDDTYMWGSGTSQASPFVAGLAALIRSADADQSQEEVQQIIKDTAYDLYTGGWDNKTGYGRIDAAAALQALLPAAPTLSPISNAGNGADYVVDWDDATNADWYVLEEDDNDAFSSPLTRYIGANSEYTVTGQRANRWHYRVRAFNELGASLTWSASVSTTVDPLLLDPPPALTTPINPEKSQTYTVTWTAVPSATYYTLEESHTPYFEAPTQVYSGTGTLYPTTDHALGTWYYRVRAFDGGSGSSAWSLIQPVRVAPYEVFLPLTMRSAQ
jgi:subtilisin family serine protease